MAIVTGGDSGIGRAVALAFAREGAHVTLHVFLASDDSRYVSGEIMGVTGGSPLA